MGDSIIIWLFIILAFLRILIGFLKYLMTEIERRQDLG